MKLGVIKKIDKQDLAAKGDLPEWVDALISSINQFIEPVGKALSQRLDFENNLLCRKIEAEFTSGTALTFQPSTNSPIQNPRVIGMIPVHTNGATLTGQNLTQNSDGTVDITLTFSGATTATFRLYLLLG